MATRLHPWRRLGDNRALTAQDWNMIDSAHQAFVYQVRTIVEAAEQRADECLTCWACHGMYVPSDCIRCQREHPDH